jgi:glutathione peroxidase
MAKIDYNTPVTSIDGSEGTLADYEGKVLLIVNTASKCGFTPQFKGLEAVWQEYRERGLAVLGFPCNQFGGQDPGTNDEIAEFCQLNYGVSFPMHAKIDVNGVATHPLFQQLKSGAPGILGTEKIKWNFTKFLVGRDGEILDRFAPKDAPESLKKAIEAAL